MTTKPCSNCGMQIDVDSKHCSHCGAAIIPPSDGRSQSDLQSQTPAGPIGGLSGNIQIVAVIEIALGIISLGVSLSMFGFMGLTFQQGMGGMLFGFGGTMFGMGGGMMDMMGVMGSANNMMAGFGVSPSMMQAGISVLTLLYGGSMILFGLGLYLFRGWGRFGSMIIGAVSLFFIPVGTIFGAVTLYLLSRPGVPSLFRK